MIIRFQRFSDNRGYFSEPFRETDFFAEAQLSHLAGARFVQVNESYSNANVVRGLHFQWNPFMGKLVRTIHGRMTDIILDIRKGSPTLGKALLYDLPSSAERDYNEWIWVPPGFAHGNYFTKETCIEYFCTGEYSPGCEAGISPAASDIDWSLADPSLVAELSGLLNSDAILSEKDRAGLSLSEWLADPRSENFTTQNISRW